MPGVRVRGLDIWAAPPLLAAVERGPSGERLLVDWSL